MVYIAWIGAGSYSEITVGLLYGVVMLAWPVPDSGFYCEYAGLYYCL